MTRMAAALIVMAGLARSDEPAQPIAFSHVIHANYYQIDCQYCHAGARRSAVAGIPSVQFCMGCHKTVAAKKPEIARLRAYWEKKTPIRWTRIVKQPDYVFFNHSPHVLKGVRCPECHGPVETMKAVRLDHSLNMNRCVSCHRSKRASIDCYTCHR
jgi:hypothetical protein